jgi:serine/threonine protein kinase
MSLAPGTRLGPYEVLATIPGGSPGSSAGAANSDSDRYKASDTRKNRVVAIKVLSPEFSDHPEMKARLESDARTISSLNHPNICALIEVGEAATSHEPPVTARFLVSEYVEGETLAQRLARRPLELQDALTVAIALADSLDKAHRRGVVHAGLNPSIVMLTAEGPKLLDFGVARLKEESAVMSGSMATTRTSVASLAAVPTTAAAYMAPEQFVGSGADARTDIFAFGAILYEMLTGRPAFQEKTLALLIAAVQTIDPDPVSKTQPMVPPTLDYLVKRCLSKDPRQRFQTALDLTSELRWIARGGTQVGSPASVVTSRKKQDLAVWAALATVSLVAVGLLPSTLSSFRSAPEPEEAHFLAAGIPTAVNTPLAVSPDGRWLATSAGGTNVGVRALPLDSVTPQLLIRENVVFQPFWSPDSRSIAFFEDGKLKRADITGGPAQIICDTPTPISAGTWNNDGVILFPGAGLIQRVLAAGGQPMPITALDESKQETEHVAPVFLPDGRHFLFLAVSSQPDQSAVYVGMLDSTERKRLFAAESKTVYAAPGYLLFNRGNTVFAHAFDANTLTLKGEPIRVASGVPTLAAGVNTSPSHTSWAAFGVSQTGVLAYRTGAAVAVAGAGTDELRSLVWFDRTGQASASIGTAGTYAGLDLSPDGKRFAVHRHEGTGGDNWFFDLAQGRMQRLTFDATQDNSSPVWSPDGARVAFASQRNSKWGLYVKLANGTASDELITESEIAKAPMSWSPDGKLLVYQQSTGAVDVWAVPVTGDKKPFALLQSQFAEQFPQVSADGKWLAYQSNETGRAEIYVKPFPEGPGKWQVSVDGGQFPRWRRDGKELFFYFNNNLFAADIRVADASLDPGVPRTLFGLPGPSLALTHGPYNRFAVSADGQRFLFSQPGAGGPTTVGGLADTIAAVVDRGGTGASATTNAVTVVLNWTQMLKKK